MPLVPGALSNPEHVKFGLRGCFAASLCYIAYNSLFWPEISTAVTTCLLTSLSTVGSSRQKQVLRFTGALVGGVGIGMGAQIFVLPYIDSIAAFTVLFVAVATAAAWIATSSARLSYFGVQIFVAFCLINLQEFKIQTSLGVAKDRVVGILLGLFAMWLLFDQFWSTPAGVGMKTAFTSTLRLLAQLAREPSSKDIRIAIERSYSLREAINAQFDKVRSLADGVLFEFGRSRQRDLAFRDRVLRWQPQLRTLFVMRTASLKYRLQLPGFELPEAERIFQQEFDDRSARMLEEMADRIEGQNPINDSARPLERALQVSFAGEQQHLPTPHIRSFHTLLRGIDSLTTSLWEEIAKEFNRPEQLATIEKIDRETGLERAWPT
jgi:multidrug resistance protein MdtO